MAHSNVPLNNEVPWDKNPYIVEHQMEVVQVLVITNNLLLDINVNERKQTNQQTKSYI